MENRTVVASLMLGLLVFPMMSGVTSAQDLPDPPGEPENGLCAFPAALGSLFTNCSTGQHDFSTLIRHGIDGSVFVEGLGIASVSSRIAVRDNGSPSGWVVVHRIDCRAPVFGGVSSDLQCEESGALPEPGTRIQHDCWANRAVVGNVVCSITYLR